MEDVSVYGKWIDLPIEVHLWQVVEVISKQDLSNILITLLATFGHFLEDTKRSPPIITGRSNRLLSLNTTSLTASAGSLDGSTSLIFEPGGWRFVGLGLSLGLG
jgi:hypothetical protein